MEKPPALYIVADATASCYFLLEGALVYAPIGNAGPDWGAVAIVSELSLVPPRVVDALRILTPGAAVLPGEPVSAEAQPAHDLSMPLSAMGGIPAQRPANLAGAISQLRSLISVWEGSF